MNNDYDAYKKEVERERKEGLYQVLMTVFLLLGFISFVLFYGKGLYYHFVTDWDCVEEKDIYFNEKDSLWHLKSSDVVFDGILCNFHGDSRYVSGKKEGPHSSYYQEHDYNSASKYFFRKHFLFSDIKRWTRNYSNGQLNGIWEEYDLDGNVIEYSNYSNGKLHGENGVFENGQWKKEQYLNGVLVNNTTDEVNVTPAPPPPPPPPPSKTFAVIVGIDDYRNADDYSGDLRFAKDDSYEFDMFFLSEYGGQVPENNISVITDNKATRVFIRDELRRMSRQANASDRLIFYFSGHGKGDYFLPSDFNTYEENYLTIQQIDKIFGASNAKHKLLIADACINDDPQRGRSTSTVAQDFNNRLNSYKPSFVHLRSCQDHELSYESVDYQNGFFSHWLIKGLKGPADYNGDRTVTIKELFNYLKNNVNNDVNYNIGAYQNPQLYGIADPNLPMSTLK